jgi:hypothetical protein
MMRSRWLSGALLVASVGCGGAADPLPELVSAELYDSEVRVSGDTALPARAVLQRDPTGQVFLVLRGYTGEDGGVRHWEQRIEIRLAISVVENAVVLNDREQSHIIVEQPLTAGMGEPVLVLGMEGDGAFEGSVAADVEEDATGATRRIEATFGGVLEAVECDADSGADPVTLGTAEFPCTATELGVTLGQPPA